MKSVIVCGMEGPLRSHLRITLPPLPRILGGSGYFDGICCRPIFLVRDDRVSACDSVGGSNPKWYPPDCDRWPIFPPKLPRFAGGTLWGPGRWPFG